MPIDVVVAEEAQLRLGPREALGGPIHGLHEHDCTADSPELGSHRQGPPTREVEMHGCRSRQVLVLAALVLAARPAAAAPPAAASYPGPGDAWERRAPEAVGISGAKFDR